MRTLKIAGIVAGIISVIIAAIALVVQIGSWLFPREKIDQLLENHPSSQLSENQYFLFDDFENSERNFDTAKWVCETENCNSQNSYHLNGVLNINNGNEAVKKVSIISKDTFRLTDLVSFEGRLFLNKDSVGGAWLGVGEIGCGIENLLTDLGNPFLICRVDGIDSLFNRKTAKLDTWYKVRIDFNESTQDASFFINDQLIGSHNIQSLPTETYVYMSVWKEAENAAFGHFDNIFVKLKP